MKLRELIGLCRSETDDVTQPYLWSDADWIEYAVDAENEACRRARLLIDSSTAAVCQIAVVAGTALYALDDLVLFVRRAKLSSQDIPLARVSYRDLDAFVPGWESHTGTPTHYATDYETGKVRLYPNPTANATLSLTVVRLPITDMNDLEDMPEIKAHYHRSLRFWMLYRAYAKQDSETKDDAKAATNLALFEQEFGKKSSAIDEEWIEREQAADPYDGTF